MQIRERKPRLYRRVTLQPRLRWKRIHPVPCVRPIPRRRSTSPWLGPCSVHRGRRSGARARRCSAMSTSRSSGGHLHSACLYRPLWSRFSGSGCITHCRTHARSYALPSPTNSYTPILVQTLFTLTPALLLARGTCTCTCTLTFLLPCTTPKPMSFRPSTALTLFPTVFSFPTPSAPCKVARGSFPFTAKHVHTLLDASTTLVLAARVPHDHTGPVLDFRGKGWWGRKVGFVW